MSRNNFNQILGVIKSAKTILIAGHENPEGDSLGSAIALGLGLKKLKKNIKIYQEDFMPESLKFLPGFNLVSLKLNLSEQYDLAIMVDVGERLRVGPAFASHPGFRQVISIDHHAVGIHEGNYNYVVPKAAATGVLIYHLLKRLGLNKFDRKIATNLYCAISTDTGSFRYSNTDEGSLYICAELLKYGVDVREMSIHYYESNPRSKVELLGRALSSITFHASGKIALMILSQKDAVKTGAELDDADGFVNYARSIEGVEIAISLIEVEKNEVNISFRSKNYVNVGRLASQFGGGGHVQAAGCKMSGVIGNIKRQILREASKLI